MPSPLDDTRKIDLNGGWIRLYRKTLESAVFQNETLLKIWIWCLLRAGHSAQTVSVKTGYQPGNRLKRPIYFRPIDFFKMSIKSGISVVLPFCLIAD